MGMRILVTRPIEDGEEIAARLRAMGHTPLLAPLLSTDFHDGPEPDFAGVQAILASSANGIRALMRRTVRRDLTIFAVGPQTAEEAKKAGFTRVRNANGDAKALAEATLRWTTPGAGALLHVCGEEAPGILADTLIGHGFAVRRCALYAVHAAGQLPPDAHAALKQQALDAALFFSPRSARVFCELAADLPLAGVTGFCISPVTARALGGQGFGRVVAAAEPNQAALLVLLE
jgi:uroporphyrinogen-III synthase